MVPTHGEAEGQGLVIARTNRPLNHRQKSPIGTCGGGQLGSTPLPLYFLLRIRLFCEKINDLKNIFQKMIICIACKNN